MRLAIQYVKNCCHRARRTVTAILVCRDGTNLIFTDIGRPDLSLAILFCCFYISAKSILLSTMQKYLYFSLSLIYQSRVLFLEGL